MRKCTVVDAHDADVLDMLGSGVSKTGEIILRRNGAVTAIDDPSPELLELLAPALTYNRVTPLHGKEARLRKSRMKSERTACYQVQVPDDPEFPIRFLVGSGFIWRLLPLLRDAGYTPRVVNEHPEDPEVFTPQWDRVANIEWRYRQKFIVEQLARYPYGRIDCPPGYGKSFIIRAYCMLYPQANIVVTTHNADPLFQLHEAISEVIPVVGLISSKRKMKGYKVWVVSGKSLHKVPFDVDILLADECHELGSVAYCQSFAQPSLYYARKYGFSANVEDRLDGAHFEQEGLFGPIIGRVTYQKAMEHGCIVPLRVQWRDVRTSNNPIAGVDDAVEMEALGLWTHDYRNQCIADDARSFADDEQVLIAVETVEHALNLKRLLPEFTLCHGETGLSPSDRRWYVTNGYIEADEPQMTTARRRRLKAEFEAGKLKKVIANSVWKRGVDFKGLAVLIRADGKSNAVSSLQIPGRTTRTCDATGKEYSTVFDYLDQFDGRLERRALQRSRHYQKQGWTELWPSAEVSQRKATQRRTLRKRK